METPIIKIENLSKRYLINHQGDRPRYTALRDVISNRIKTFFSKRESTNIAREEFWALRDVGFQVAQGDRIGIIGRNGAGKSTLLKILSRITEPTKGQITIRGRVASLLEVGTGFHPELTGRENIFLNGAILGMKRTEINRKFDEIVTFAEIEKFLDTPVKRYSSGMCVKLAFAVASHLDQEILVLDEVLAVGDAQFQKKCLGKMDDISKNDGKTILFVSHNMLAIKSLCTSGIVLDKGSLVFSGSIDKVVDYYDSRDNMATSSSIELNKTIGDICLQSLNVSSNGVNGQFNINKDLIITFKINNHGNTRPLNFNLFFHTNDGSLIFATCSKSEALRKGDYVYSCTIPANTLNDIEYHLDLMVVADSTNVLLKLKDIISIQGIEQHREGPWMGQFPGLIRPLYYKWERRLQN